MRSGEVTAVIRRQGEVTILRIALFAVAGGAIWLTLFQPAAVEYSQLAQGLIVIWLCGWLIFLLTEIKTVITSDGMEVTNLGVRYWVPFAAVSWVQSTDEIVLHLVRGQRLKLAVGAWSLASRVRGNPKQRELSDSINSAIRNAKAKPKPDQDIHRELHLRLVSALIALAVLEVLAYLGAQL